MLTEKEVCNHLRAHLAGTQLTVTQLVHPGGQAAVSLSIPNTDDGKRRKTVFPDLICHDFGRVFVGEVKPSYSEADAQKLLEIMSSEDAVLQIFAALKNRGHELDCNASLSPLLIHSELKPIVNHSITQLVFVEDGIFTIREGILASGQSPFH